MTLHSPATRRHLLGIIGAATLASMALPRNARAQQALDTVKIVLGVPAGSMIDQSARKMGEALTNGGYATTTVVENRTGAAGILAVSFGKAAAPDGRTVLVATSSSTTLFPLTYAKLPYEPRKDLIPVSTLLNFDLGLAVGPMVPREVTNLREFYAWCKANPTKASFGSPGSGSTPHFQGLMTARNAGVEILHVAYRGPSAAVTDMIGGQLAAAMVPLSDLLEFAATGKCRILATTGEGRSRLAPRVATFAEQGMGEYAMRPWIGVFLPAGTPAAIVQKLSTTLKAALSDKAFTASLETQGQEVEWSSPEAMKARMEAERTKWEAAVKALNFTPES
jgi:tripartite-type tricarboxylate transporter receptor subunit TctC